MTDDLGTRGARLWTSLLAQDVSLDVANNPMREVALSACRTADRVQLLEERAALVDPVVEGKSGPTTHPVYVEVRQQETTLARLIAVLRLPDEVSGKKPQRRQLRGVQQPSGKSARDRLKAV